MTTEETGLSEQIGIKLISDIQADVMDLNERLVALEIDNKDHEARLLDLETEEVK